MSIKSTIPLTVLALFLHTASAQNQLPSLGDRISGTVTLEQEYAMGQDFLRSIRRSAPTISDPLLTDYLENLTYKLASKSQLQDHRLSFVIIDSQDLNAFAAPGGIIGVNTGLFLNAETEGEFASVMAHEIAHVSQRHFARGIDEAQASRIPQLATLLASVVIMATSDARHGQAAIAASQGMAVESQLRFSRSNEAEADRIGINNLYNAGFDPADMSHLFERLLSLNRFGRRPPEFLLSHPVTESRIADSRGRAMRFPSAQYRENLEYLIVRARVRAHYAEDKEDIISEYQKLLERSTDTVQIDGNRYGLAVSYWENEDYAEAAAALAPLLAKQPNRISYVVTQAEILTSQNEPLMALNYLTRHLEINPNNHPLSMAYAYALIEARQYTEAAKFMQEHARNRSEDGSLWYLIAETEGQAGNISQVHQARAEYFTLMGDYRNAREQLQYALRLETEKGEDLPLEAKIRQKLKEVEAAAQVYSR
ncbi:MAG: peptidase M48 [SAR86 cluster bacterium]|uniref:Putative beta-barrel assembly-enhancing protease n=1 Tax=SAR86 cluster bacterium TaxID=2030880 RepID=A0A2A4MLD3_9GAMM|nr:MAG: peptidase M48 [SAR86 cluster bacterium]